MRDLLTLPRTRRQRGTRMLVKGRTPGISTARLLWDSYVMAYGDPTIPRQEWEFQGPGIAQMMRGPIMKRIPRELRRIYAPYP
jgi:hypothetical protein